MGASYKHVPRRFNWKPDDADPRDIWLSDELDTFGIAHSFVDAPPLAKVFSLSDKLPKIWDQKNEGSCTAFAGETTIVADQMNVGAPEFEPSHNYTYFNTRWIEGNPWQDKGAMCRSVLKAFAWQGYCLAETYPYDPKLVLQRPPRRAYLEGQKRLVSEVRYARVGQNLDEIKTALAAGLPIFFGIYCFKQIDSADAAKTGVLKMPSRGERAIGGHAIAAIGWDDNRKMVQFRNSWSQDWGDKGNGWLPFDYVTRPELSSDFWVLKSKSAA